MCCLTCPLGQQTRRTEIEHQYMSTMDKPPTEVCISMFNRDQIQIQIQIHTDTDIDTETDTETETDTDINTETDTETDTDTQVLYQYYTRVATEREKYVRKGTADSDQDGKQHI